LRFEYDHRKALTNLRKHDVSFDEAESVFDDTLSAVIKDELHSINEVRWLIIGMSDFDRLVIVSFTQRDDNIRLISARKPTKQEVKEYEEGKRRRD